MPEFKDGNFRL